VTLPFTFFHCKKRAPISSDGTPRTSETGLAGCRTRPATAGSGDEIAAKVARDVHPLATIENTRSVPPADFQEKNCHLRDSVAAPLRPLALRRPIRKPPHASAMLPGQFEKFAGGHFTGWRA